MSGARRRDGSDHQQLVRAAELEAVGRWFPPGTRVLEVGAGNGFQASLLAANGCDVTAVDIAAKSGTPLSYYPVTAYDGITLPFASASFDVVYSSHVLAHVVALAPLLDEMKRVARRDGILIHLVPTASWRFWNSVLHYPARLRRFAHLAADAMSDDARNDDDEPLPSVGRRVLNSLVPVPLGTSPTSFHELYRFRVSSWKQLFETAGLSVETVVPTGVFFTGHRLAPALAPATRRRLARLAGSSSAAFVLRRAAT